MRKYHIQQGYESKSGPGSAIICTRVIDAQISQLLPKFEIFSILDAGCGDCHWISRIPLIHEAFIQRHLDAPIKYYGIDIVPEQIIENERRFGRASAVFLCGSLMEIPLPTVDLIICRDVLVHLSKEVITKVIQNFKASHSRYLLTTTFPKHDNNILLSHPGGFRPINFEIWPYNLGKPIEVFNEGSQRTKDQKYKDKSLGLWRLT